MGKPVLTHSSRLHFCPLFSETPFTLRFLLSSKVLREELLVLGSWSLRLMASRLPCPLTSFLRKLWEGVPHQNEEVSREKRQIPRGRGQGVSGRNLPTESRLP
jgi:hypothetical protein